VRECVRQCVARALRAALYLLGGPPPEGRGLSRDAPQGVSDLRDLFVSASGFRVAPREGLSAVCVAVPGRLAAAAKGGCRPLRRRVVANRWALLGELTPSQRVDVHSGRETGCPNSDRPAPAGNPPWGPTSRGGRLANAAQFGIWRSGRTPRSQRGRASDRKAEISFPSGRAGPFGEPPIRSD